MGINELWEELINYGIATEQEIQLVTSINGFNVQTLNDICYVRTGYNNINDFIIEVLENDR